METTFASGRLPSILISLFGLCFLYFLFFSVFSVISMLKLFAFIPRDAPNSQVTMVG